MSVDFKYKDFVNQLRFQVVKNCPDFTEWNWDDGEKYVRDVFYFHTIKYGEICHDNPLIDVESAEAITQVIAEWTFHKTIDLICGQIPLDFHKSVLEHINKKIYEYFNRPDVNEITKGAYFTEKSLSDVQKLVKDTYRAELAQIYSDNGIDKDTYTNALSLSHFDDYCNSPECGEDGEWDMLGKKIDKFVARRIIKEAFEGHLRDYIRLTGFKLYFLVLLSICLYVLSLLYKNIFCIVCATLYMLVCFGYVVKSYMSMRVDELQEYVKDYKQEAEDWKIYRNPNQLYERLGVDVMSITVGQKLINYFDPENSMDLISFASQLRKELTDDLGYIIPNIRFTDCDAKGYEVFLSVRGVLRDKFVLNPVKDDIREVIFNHTRNCCIKYVNEILTKTDVIKVMEVVRIQDPTLVNDLIPAEISATDFRRILVNLLREEVSIKDITKIFERLAEFVKQNKNPYILSERLRVELGGMICQSLAVSDKKNGMTLYLADLSSHTEKVLLNRLQSSEFGSVINLNSEEYTKLFNTLDINFKKLKKIAPDNVVIITQASLRYPLFKILSVHHPFIKIISYAELPNDLPVKVEHVFEI